MKSAAISLFLLALGTVAAPTPGMLAPVTTAAQLDSDIDVLDAAVKQFTTTQKAYMGGALTLAPTLASFLQVTADLNKAGYDASNLPDSVSNADATTITNKVKSTIAVDSPAAIKVLQSKKQYYKAEDADVLVRGALESLLAAYLFFSNEVQEKFSDAAKKTAGPVFDATTNAIEDGIKTYST